MQDLESENDIIRELIKVGDLAKLTGKTVRAIHFYEEMDILRPVERTKGGFRLYNKDAITRVSLIEKLQVLGLSIPEIKELLLTWEDSETGFTGAKKIFEALTNKRKHLKEEIERLKSLENELQDSLEYLSYCTTCCEKKTVPTACACCTHACVDQEKPAFINGLYQSAVDTPVTISTA